MPYEPQTLLKIDIERMRQVYDDLRESQRDFLSACTDAYIRATELNKGSE